MKTLALTIILAIAAHQAVGAMLASANNDLTKHNAQIELAVNEVR